MDASLPRSAAAVLRDLRHEAIDVRDIGMRGATDHFIADHARRSQTTLITRDFDFADIRNCPPGDYTGIVVLDLPNHADAAQVVKVLEKFVRTNEWLELLGGRLAIVELSRVRFRPAP